MKKSKWLLSLTTLLFSLLAAEFIISLFFNFPDGYYLTTPNTTFIWKSDSLVNAGIDEDAFVEFNDLGARVSSNRKDKKKTILAIGGSTTACFTLDQKRMWTALLEKKLGSNYWVPNFGKQGSASSHHVLQLKKILEYPNMPEIEKVVVMMGKNDISASLINAKKYVSRSDFEIAVYAFKHMPDSVVPFYRRLGMAKLYKNAKHNLIRMYRRKTHGEQLVDCRKARLKTKRVNELPNLSSALAYYEKNALELITIAREHQVEIVFVSQAVLWNKNLEEDDKKLICSHVSDKNIHYSASALYEGMQQFNSKLENVCKREGVVFIRNDVPSTAKIFFDDCHYTIAGAELTADNIYKGLLSRTPL